MPLDRQDARTSGILVKAVVRGIGIGIRIGIGIGIGIAIGR